MIDVNAEYIANNYACECGEEWHATNGTVDARTECPNCGLVSAPKSNDMHNQFTLNVEGGEHIGVVGGVGVKLIKNINEALVEHFDDSDIDVPITALGKLIDVTNKFRHHGDGVISVTVDGGEVDVLIGKTWLYLD